MKNKKGFTLIELLVVIAIIGLLATIAFISLNSARGKARDAKRISDVRTIQSALELYYNDQVTPGYPVQSPAVVIALSWNALVPSYAAAIPTAPLPNETGCSSAGNAYTYQSTGTGTETSYTVSFCLGSASGGLIAGCVQAKPTGMGNAACLIP